MSDEFLYDWWMVGVGYLGISFLFLYIGTFGLERLLWELGGRQKMVEKLCAWKQFLLVVLLCLFQLVAPIGILWLLDNFVQFGILAAGCFVVYFIYLLHVFTRERL